jgi:hypothetical protein
MDHSHKLDTAKIGVPDKVICDSVGPSFYGSRFLCLLSFQDRPNIGMARGWQVVRPKSTWTTLLKTENGKRRRARGTECIWGKTPGEF